MIESGNHELLNRLRKCALEADTIPEGYKSCKEWAKEFGISESHAQKLLRVGTEKGEMVSMDLRVFDQDAYKRARYYKPV